MKRFFLSIIFLLCVVEVSAQQFERVTVLRVSDGDTITALTENGEQLRVRIGAIDAPESQQEYGAQSRDHLLRLLETTTPSLDCYKRDQYRRYICKILVSNEDVGLLQIRAGAAWWYKQYAREQSVEDQRAYELAEEEARRARIGLWAKNPMPPWEWRRQQRFMK